MDQVPMSEANANRIYDLLHSVLNSSKNRRQEFINYFTGKHGEIFPEYRIDGNLNPGAKFRYYGFEKMYVDYYSEFTTKDKETLVGTINELLKSFKPL